jgi:glucose-1-phosphate thymidylyltransferase
MVERIVNTFIEVLPRPLTQAVFVLGDFPSEVNEALTAICSRHDMQASFVYQEEALGTGHAVHCAHDYLDGEIITVFADTLFSMSGPASLEDADVVAWVKHVDDPSRFGVAVRQGDQITGFVEKPKELISNEALIGIYYVREGEELRTAIQRLIDEKITGHGNEYQLTDAFDIMLKRNLVFRTAGVSEWLDCGTIDAFMETSFHIARAESATTGTIDSSNLIEPVFVGEGAVISNAQIGPNVIVESGAVVKDSSLDHSIVFGNAHVEASTLTGSMVGHSARISGASGTVNVGDHSTIG